MAVRIRMKRMGRTHRPFYRICAMDSRSPRDGRVIEELGFYDPMIRDTDARVTLKTERVDHWISIGALPTPKVGVLLRKYGTNGTHLEQQRAALEKLGMKAAYVPAERPEPEPEPEAPAAEAPAAEGEVAEGAAPAEASAEGGEEKQAEGGE